jgi:NADPH2:quinone reductase
MRAIRIGDLGRPDVLRLEDVEPPRLAPGQVLVNVVAAGVNFADINIRRGLYIMQPALPYVPGFEVAGRVVGHGPGVDQQQLPLGTRVVGLTLSGGGYAELAAVRAQHTIRLPDQLSFEQGAAFALQGLTAYHVLKTMGRLAAGETVVVEAAAGGVGTMSTQLARSFGAGTIIAAAGGPEKLRLAMKLGADAGVDYLRENYVARVNELTEGRGADLILDSVGGTMLDRSFECLAPMGRVVSLGNTSGGQVDLGGLWPRLRTRSQSLIGFSLVTIMDRPELRDPSIEHILDLVRNERLAIVIGHRFPLAEAAQAHATLEDRRSTGKIVLLVGDA